MCVRPRTCGVLEAFYGAAARNTEDCTEYGTCIARLRSFQRATCCCQVAVAKAKVSYMIRTQGELGSVTHTPLPHARPPQAFAYNLKTRKIHVTMVCSALGADTAFVHNGVSGPSKTAPPTDGPERELFHFWGKKKGQQSSQNLWSVSG
jgi:hypothetical protein